MNIRPIAIYLPQFHPIKENDEAWGKGFTEWTNVAKARPLYKGHYQPHLPADLGFYDLRIPEVREEQAKMAKEAGIHGFCYYHYWFNGRRVLERPFQEVFESGKPDFPFMLCWANENWTRIWDGGDKNVLQQQDYSYEDDLKHIQSLIPYFKDKRYIRIDNKPVFAIYRSTIFPDINKTLSIWRAEARRHNIELYICRFESYGIAGETYLKEGGFDAAIDFQPTGNHIIKYKQKYHELYVKDLKRRLLNKIKFSLLNKIDKAQHDKQFSLTFNSFDYSDYVDYVLSQPLPSYKVYPGITPMWDNSARKKKDFFIFKNESPEKYAQWLQHIVSNFVPYSNEENLIFINAWNEWAEGNHLEPDQKWGTQYLDATKEILSDNK